MFNLSFYQFELNKNILHGVQLRKLSEKSNHLREYIPCSRTQKPISDPKIQSFGEVMDEILELYPEKKKIEEQKNQVFQLYNA